MAYCTYLTNFAGLAQNCIDSPASRGPCRAAFKKWTFVDGSCQEFLYGGCRGNGNRFDSESQCQAVCGGGTRQGVSRTVQGGSSPCNQQPFVFGPCQAALRRWTYVWQTRSCQPFLFSGCSRSRGVENRFITWEECAGYCLL